MENLPHTLNYEQSRDLPLQQFIGVARQIFEASKNKNQNSDNTDSDILQKIGATIFNSIQLKHPTLNDQPLGHNSSEAANMDFDFQNRVVLDSSSVNKLQEQIEYDKFMNEVWIGIVFTLILISMVFCICSCFLYHQFRTWKRNYHNNANGSTQCTIVDIEALKLRPDLEDPVPEYTLVSGLPSYEAALELLHKTPQSSCLIVYPSVFNVFNKHERANTAAAVTAATTPTATTATIDPVAGEASSATAATLSQTAALCEATTPLLSTATTAATAIGGTTTTTATNTPTCESIKPNFVPSYAEVFGFKTIDEKKKSTKSQDDKC
ncbi:hypothetical protein KR215_005874 [Drosophila sulfurigaster]|nr:hypothetical protein KR215_005874 [Drosophila sulfurigaster]